VVFLALLSAPLSGLFPGTICRSSDGTTRLEMGRIIGCFCPAQPSDETPALRQADCYDTPAGFRLLQNTGPSARRRLPFEKTSFFCAPMNPETGRRAAFFTSAPLFQRPPPAVTRLSLATVILLV